MKLTALRETGESVGRRDFCAGCLILMIVITVYSVLPSDHKVFEPVAVALDAFQGDGSQHSNNIVEKRLEEELSKFDEWDAPRTGPKKKPISAREEPKHPNMGAGYTLMLLQGLTEKLEAVLDPEQRDGLKKCRPAAFYVYEGIMERSKFKHFLFPIFC
jgi:hypothetical protein